MEPTFRPMRRKRQELTVDEAELILRQATSGTLAVNGDDGYPYAVPVSHVYAHGKIYFHSALQGHKIDAIRANPKVSFCVIDEDNVKPQEFTTYYRSAIAFGRARIIDNEADKMAALRLLAAKYSDATVTDRMTEQEIDKDFSRLLMVEITVEHLTGKQSIELATTGHS